MTSRLKKGVLAMRLTRKDVPTMAGRGLRTKLLYWWVGCFQGGNTTPQPKGVVAYDGTIWYRGS